MHEYMSQAYARANRPVPMPVGIIAITVIFWAITGCAAGHVLLTEVARMIADQASASMPCGAC